MYTKMFIWYENRLLIMRTTIYISDDQRERIAMLPRGVSFSAIIREKFDIIMEDYENEGKIVVKAT